MTEENNEINNENGEGDKVKEENKQVHWQPVANLDPYEKVAEDVKRYHEQYIKMWNITEER